MTEAESAILNELRTISALLRLTAHSTIRELLASELASDKTLRAYQGSNGVTSQAQVANDAGVSQPTVSRLWERWKMLGLVVEGAGGRARAVFDPAAYGVGVGAPDSAGQGRAQAILAGDKGIA